jgi:hypothetical protein
MVALGVFGVGKAVAAAPAHNQPRITIAVLPHGTTPAQLARLHGMATGLLSAGIGQVPAAQTYLDIGQGARASSVLYDEPLPLLYARPAGQSGPARIPPRAWDRVRERAADVPADLVPGLLGSTLQAGHVLTQGSPRLQSALAMIATEGGLISSRTRCKLPPCGAVRVVAARSEELSRLAQGLRADDLLIAIASPPPPENRALAIGVSGRGFEGTLTSDSTRMRGYVLSTDIAPTILARLGLEVPDEMTGEPMRASGSVDTAFLTDLENRLAAIGPRRGPVIGTNLLIWIGLAALAGVVFGVRGLRTALPVFAVAVAWLPAVLLLTAALEPSELVERLVAGVGAPALALLTVRLAGGFGALAIAGGLSVAAYAVDVVAGSHLTELSLMGPNPAEGVRFYGIGNELEATVAALVPIATGAAVTAWAPPRITARRAALGFVLTAVAAVAVFAPGRFGADVGAAIGIPVGAAVAALACLGGGRRRIALAIAAPIAALAALVLADLVLGGNAHLTRTVLRAGGLDQLAQVAERRLRLSAHSFSYYSGTAVLWIVVAVIVAGAFGRRAVESWFGSRRVGWAGFLGAAGATVAGTLANDSGALLLMIGATLCAATAGLAWATEPQAGARREIRDGPEFLR